MVKVRETLLFAFSSRTGWGYPKDGEALPSSMTRIDILDSVHHAFQAAYVAACKIARYAHLRDMHMRRTSRIMIGAIPEVFSSSATMEGLQLLWESPWKDNVVNHMSSSKPKLGHEPQLPGFGCHRGGRNLPRLNYRLLPLEQMVQGFLGEILIEHVKRDKKEARESKIPTPKLSEASAHQIRPRDRFCRSQAQRWAPTVCSRHTFLVASHGDPMSRVHSVGYSFRRNLAHQRPDCSSSDDCPRRIDPTFLRRRRLSRRVDVGTRWTR